MNIKEIIIKLFNKKKAVRVIFIDENSRVSVKWGIPSADHTTVLLAGMTDGILLNNKTRLINEDGVPTYIVKYDNAEPIDVFELKKGYRTTQEIDLILNNDLAQKAYRVSAGGKLSYESKLILGVMALLVLMLGYFLNTKIVDLESKIVPEPTPIVEEVVINE